MGIKNEVLEFLKEKYNNIDNFKDKFKIRNINVIKEDLECLIDLISTTDFIEINKNNNFNDNLYYIPRGYKSNSTIYYDCNFKKLPKDQQIYKSIAEIFFYFNGSLGGSENDVMSFIYLALAHFGLIDIKPRYAQMNRKEIFVEINSSISGMVLQEITGIKFLSSRMKYYEKFQIKNAENYITRFLVKEKYSFEEGKVLKLCEYKHHLLMTGFMLFDRRINAPLLLSKYKINAKFEDLKKEKPNYTFYNVKYKYVYLSNNNEIITNNKIKKLMNEKINKIV